MRAYKGFNRHEDGTLWCRDFQYEVGKTYKFEGEPVMCEQGFHACREPWQCWTYYPNNGENVYYEVECGGTVIENEECVEFYECDGKFVCTEITLVREMPALENKFDWCSYFQDGRAIVRLKGKFNYINTEGKYLFEQWWNNCGYFQDDYAIVELDNKYNFINTEGKYISKQWFDYCWDFRDGYGVVKLNHKYNHITADGRLVSEQWFDWCGNFCNGYGEVALNGKWFKLDKTGKLIQL